MDNLALWIAMGLALAVAFGWFSRPSSNKPPSKKDDPPDDEQG